jgi:hypothetical protein
MGAEQSIGSATTDGGGREQGEGMGRPPMPSAPPSPPESVASPRSQAGAPAPDLQLRMPQLQAAHHTTEVPIVRAISVSVEKASIDTSIGLILDGDEGAPRVKAIVPRSLVANTHQIRVDQRLLEVMERRRP